MERNRPARISSGGVFPSVEFYGQVIDSLHDYAILTVGLDLHINSWSSESCKIFGYQRKEVIGKPFDIIFTDEDKKEGISTLEIETAFREGKASDNRYHQRKDGSTFYAYGLVFPIRDKDGALLGYVKILRDLTERRKAEEALNKYVKDLEELNTHKESILAILSHDLRGPLGTIVGIAQYLKSDLAHMGQEEIIRMVDILYQASSDELNMLDYLLEWARIKYASEAFTPTPIDLHHKVNKVFETFQRGLAVKSIRLENEIAENTFVFADKKMILSILQNLVTNAIEHSPHGGTITVTARAYDQMMLVQVKDTGIGMSAQIQEKLFTPHLKILSKSREEGKGAGIGLLLAKGFVEKHGGEICVDSVKGEGTSFYFTLPTEKPPDKIQSENQNEFDLYQMQLYSSPKCI